MKLDIDSNEYFAVTRLISENITLSLHQPLEPKTSEKIKHLYERVETKIHLCVSDDIRVEMVKLQELEDHKKSIGVAYPFWSIDIGPRLIITDAKEFGFGKLLVLPVRLENKKKWLHVWTYREKESTALISVTQNIYRTTRQDFITYI